MGTSISQPSRKSTSWAAVQATYRSNTFPVERVIQEVWRAAQIEADQSWLEMLSAPIVGDCLAITIHSESPAQAVNAVSRAAAGAKQASLAVEIVKRAVAESVLANDRAQLFSQIVFAEATNYLVSRDLPGFVGERWRNRTVGEMVEFKASIQQHVRAKVSEVDITETAATVGWADYVAETIRHLAESES